MNAGQRPLTSIGLNKNIQLKYVTMMNLKQLAAVCVAVVGGGLNGCTPVSSHNQEPVVQTHYGAVSGSIDDGIYAFKGIPYAKADRFMPPQEPDAWEGVRKHKAFGPIAMQVNSWSDEAAMDEDELFTVNVWTQGVSDGKERPVMLWLHGGGFRVGASDDPITDGKNLAQKGDVVLVSVNHRLNVLGFLDLSDFGERYEHSANVGMLDIVAALEWINLNIERFGGDPDNVTVFGESGGGGKVGTLMSMPAAKGLFHKAVIQSGTLVNVMTKKKSRKVGRAVVENLGMSEEDVSGLDTVAYSKLVEAGNEAVEETLGVRTPGSREVFGFVPVPDGVTLLQQPFTPGFADTSEDVPLLIGTTFNELMETAYAEKDLSMKAARKRIEKTYGEQTAEYVARFGEAYPDHTPQDLLSIDTVFRPSTIRTADARSEERVAPVYTYMLTWKSPVEDGAKGSFHGLDIPLVFDNIELGKHWTGTGSDARLLADKMSAAWINFARNGDPNVNGVLPLWEPYSKENGETMIFDTDCKIVNHHDRALMELIDSVQ